MEETREEEEVDTAIIMKEKTVRKDTIIFFLICFLILGLSGYLYFGYKGQQIANDICYSKMIVECDACNAKNMTYFVCDRKCIPYRGDESGCGITFWQNCTENVPYWCHNG